jgi:hypothetical protein
MKALARSYNAPEQHFKAAEILVDIRGLPFINGTSGTITKSHKHCMVFISDNTGGAALTLNGSVILRTAKTQQAYRIPFEVTSYDWTGSISGLAVDNVTIIGFN